MSDKSPVVKPVFADGLAGYNDQCQFYMWFDPYARDGVEQRPGWVCSSNIHDVSEEVCPLCASGWEKTVKSFRDQHWSREHFAHVHRSCYERHLGFIEREQWVGIFTALDLEDFFGSFDKSHMAIHAMLRTLKTIPNEYGGAWNTPWYEISLVGLPGCPVAKLKFGSRKSVFNIEVRGITKDALTLLETKFIGAEFRGGAVTQGIRYDAFYIHAWTKDDAFKYIAKIVNLVKEKGSYVHQDSDATVPT